MDDLPNAEDQLKKKKYWNGNSGLTLFTTHLSKWRIWISTALWFLVLAADIVAICFDTRWNSDLNNREIIIAVLEQTLLLICITVWLFQAHGIFSNDNSVLTTSNLFKNLLETHDKGDQLKREFKKFYDIDSFYTDYNPIGLVEYKKPRRKAEEAEIRAYEAKTAEYESAKDALKIKDITEYKKWKWENDRRIFALILIYGVYIAGAVILVFQFNSLDWRFSNPIISLTVVILFAFALLINMFTFVNTFRDVLYVSQVSKHTDELVADKDYNRFNPALSTFIQDLDQVFRHSSIIYSVEVLLFDAFSVLHVISFVFLFGKEVKGGSDEERIIVSACLLGLFLGVITALVVTIGVRYYLNKIISKLRKQAVEELGDGKYSWKNQDKIEKIYLGELKKSKSSKIAIINFVAAVLGLLAQVIVLYVKAHWGS